MNISDKNIAILGATSHIAKGLIYGFIKIPHYNLFLFARSPDMVSTFLSEIKAGVNIHISNIDAFNLAHYDVVVNCVGLGDPARLKSNISSIFRLTEAFDNLILDYLKKNPGTLYINFSSGTAYGTDFDSPADESTCSKWDTNHITETDYYGIAKFHSEAKHRALADLNIVDLRIFSYFSRFINPESKFLICEILSCLRNGREFVTGPDNIIRDYIHPEDLMALIECCIRKKKLNDVFDAYSQQPATKFEILEYFKNKHGLKYIINNAAKLSAITGSKVNYYSNNKRAQEIGYEPRFTSMDCIAQESELFQKI